MKEIHFDSPPQVTAFGSFSPGDELGTDMHLFVKGNRFHWNKITADSVQGGIHFHFRTVEVTNIQAGFTATELFKVSLKSNGNGIKTGSTPILVSPMSMWVPWLRN